MTYILTVVTGDISPHSSFFPGYPYAKPQQSIRWADSQNVFNTSASHFLMILRTDTTYSQRHIDIIIENRISALRISPAYTKTSSAYTL